MTAAYQLDTMTMDAMVPAKTTKTMKTCGGGYSYGSGFSYGAGYNSGSDSEEQKQEED